MKKQVLLIAIAGLFSAGASAQLFTPQGTIQGQTSNQQVGIGENTPDGTLHIKSTFKTLLHLESFGQLIPSGQGNIFAFPTKAFVIEDQTGQYGTNGEVFTIFPNGRTRIGSFGFSPGGENLVVRSNFGVYFNTDSRIKMNVSPSTSQVLWRNTNSTSNLEFKNESTNRVPLRLSPEGKVGVNTDYFPGNHSLYVQGSMIMEEGWVKLIAAWGDFVFDPEYPLLSLTELEDYLVENRHLPGFPTAAEVAENGVALGETQRLLTIKVEELTLYILALQKEIDLLKAAMLENGTPK